MGTITLVSEKPGELEARGRDGGVNLRTAVFEYAGTLAADEIFEDPNLLIPGDSQIVGLEVYWGLNNAAGNNYQPHIQIEVADVNGMKDPVWTSLLTDTGRDSQVTSGRANTVLAVSRAHPEMLRVTEHNRRVRARVESTGNISYAGGHFTNNSNFGRVVIDVRFVNL